MVGGDTSSMFRNNTSHSSPILHSFLLRFQQLHTITASTAGSAGEQPADANVLLAKSNLRHKRAGSPISFYTKTLEHITYPDNLLIDLLTVS